MLPEVFKLIFGVLGKAKQPIDAKKITHKKKQAKITYI